MVEKNRANPPAFHRILAYLILAVGRRYYLYESTLRISLIISRIIGIWRHIFEIQRFWSSHSCCFWIWTLRFRLWLFFITTKNIARRTTILSINCTFFLLAKNHWTRLICITYLDFCPRKDECFHFFIGLKLYCLFGNTCIKMRTG